MPGSARNLEELAAELGRPPTGLSALKDLTPDQVALLSDLIDETIARRRRDLDRAFARAIPQRPPRAAALAFLRRGPR